MEGRSTLIIPEKKEKINKIKEKYNNPNMDDKTATKIASLEVTNDILKTASAIAGVAFVIDLIVPDPVIGIDEALLGIITALTKTANNIIDNKIDDLAKEGKTSLSADETKELASQINKLISNVKGKKSNKTK